MLTTDSIAGREPELELLRSFCREDRGAAVALLTGEAGVGKTTVLLAATAEAARSGARVLWARPTQAEASSSYAALDDVMRPVLGLLARLAEPQRRGLAGALLLEDVDVPVEPRLDGLACLSLLDEVAEPVLLAVDDWQWLDAASAAVLSFIVRRLSATRTKVIATVRSREADEAVAALVRGLRDREVLELMVSALDAAALHQLVHGATGHWLSPPALERLLRASGGNPLLALELVREPGVRSAIDVRRLLGRRIGALSHDARAVLRFTAALAEPTTETIEKALGDVAPARRGLEDGLAAEVLERDGARLRFTHPLLAAVVEERAPPSQWRATHARLAELTVKPELRARHLAVAATGPDPAVASALEDAARQAAARGAVVAAGELAERAAELTAEGDSSDRGRRLLAAADAHTASGEGQRARTLLDGLVRSSPAGPLRANALERLAYVVGDESGLGLAERALAEAGDDDELRARIHICLSSLVVHVGDLPRALGHAEAALGHAERVREPTTLAEALGTLAYMRWFGGAGVQRDALVRADELERRGTGRVQDATALELLAMQLTVAGELEEARELLLADRERAAQRGHLEHESMALRLLVEVEMRAGHWQTADGYARQALEMTLGSEYWNAEAMGRWLCALVDAHLGRVETARAHAEEGLQRSTEWGGLPWSTRCSHVLGFIELSLGDAQAALRHLAPLRASEARLGIREPALFCIGPDLAEALVLAGDLDGARAVQAELEERGRELGRTWAIATGLRCRGLIAAADGRLGDALADLDRAVEVHAGLPQPFERARTLLALGAVQRRAKQRAEARTSLNAASAMFAELGASLWAGRAQAEIARLGGRRSRDLDELTETERRIAEQAAEGRSNREIAGALFVSERTVEANLTRAYRKLGLRSRTELARHLPAR